jgi:hypothetical protein
MAAAAVACRRALLLHGQHQWPQRWAGAAVPTSAARSISQLVKTNGRRAFLVDTLALVSNSLRLSRSVPIYAHAVRPGGVRRNAPSGC